MSDKEDEKEETGDSSPEEEAPEGPEAATPEAAGEPDGERDRGLMRVGAASRTTVAEKRAEERVLREAPPPAADTDVAQAAPGPRTVVHRRTFLLGGFWAAMAGLLTAIGGGLGLAFLWPKKIVGFGAAVDVSASRIPAPGADPVRIPDGRFWLVNIAPGAAESPGGLLALYQKCPHLGCTVPWRPDFDFGGQKGWFRCPCHGSTYTKEGGILVAGPAPRPMDTMAITVKPTGDITVETGQVTQGGQDNPFRVVQYPGGGGQEPTGA